MDMRYILFDLDGTLTDSCEGICRAFEYAFSRLGIDPGSGGFKKLIGPPVVDSLKRYYNADNETANRGLKLFREYYEDRGLYENAVYGGIDTVLKTLNAHGKKLMVATAKPEHMAKKVLKHFGLSDEFCFIAGVTYDMAEPSDDPLARSTKEDVIGYILRENAITDPEHAVMVGDRSVDMLAAKKFGLQTIGAAYGYGSREELENAGADHIAETPEELIEIIVQS